MTMKMTMTMMMAVGDGGGDDDDDDDDDDDEEKDDDNDDNDSASDNWWNKLALVERDFEQLDRNIGRCNFELGHRSCLQHFLVKLPKVGNQGLRPFQEEVIFLILVDWYLVIFVFVLFFLHFYFSVFL